MKSIFACFIIFLLYANTYAQTEAGDTIKNDDKWYYEFSAGAWNTSVRGDVTANSLPANIRSSLKDKFTVPDFSFFADFEMRKNRFKLIGQFTSINHTGGGTFPNSSIYLKSHSTIRPLFFEAGLAFDFYNDKKFQVDLFAGARLNYVRNSVMTTYTNIIVRKEEENKTFIDPLAGGRFIYKPFNGSFLQNLYIKGYFDIGGFGLVSFLSFQSYLSAGYELNDNFSLRLGYRYIDVHYGLGNFLYDIGFQGLEFAATTRF